MKDYVTLPDAPEIEGLAFRHFRDDEDWPGLADVFTRSRKASGHEAAITAEKLNANYSNMKHFDISKDLLVVELDGGIAGYMRVDWANESDGKRNYWEIEYLSPELRGKGVEDTLVNWAEAHIREIDAELPAPAGGKLISIEVIGLEPDLDRAISARGYAPARYEYFMARPLEEVPEVAMPEGLDARPATPEQYHAIWEAMEEAFQDHWGAEELGDEEDFQSWLRNPWFQPHLWQVGWEGDQVAGMVLNFVDEDYNSSYNKKRGYTEDISVRRPWRRRGLASALIARSMKMFKDMGMTEVALSVDTENPSGALQLYEGLGYKVTGKATTWRKPF